MGDTNHFTSFAILLDNPTQESCDETSYVIVWLSVAFISTAICVVFTAFIAIELSFRNKKKANNPRRVEVTLVQQE